MLLLTYINDSDDARILERLYFQFAQGLINFASRFVRDKEISENIIQEVFLSIWKNRETQKIDEIKKAYLYTSVRNKALNYLRHQKIEFDYAINSIEMSAEPETPSQSFHKKMLKTSLMSVIEELPQQRKMVFTMNRLDGLTYAEIADILGLSIKTVETHMGRALKTLREKLKQVLDQSR